MTVGGTVAGAVTGFVAPEGFRVQRSEEDLAISWRSPGHWGFLVAGLLGLVLSGGLFVIFTLTSQAIVGVSILAAVGVLGSGYLFLVGAFNHTCIGICEGRLQARHGPLPCPRPRLFHLGCREALPVDGVDRVTVRREPERRAEMGLLPTYALHVETRSRGSEVLLKGLNLEEAEYVQRELAAFLGLKG